MGTSGPGFSTGSPSASSAASRRSRGEGGASSVNLVVNALRAFHGGFLGRYTHRVALSNGRLVRSDERTLSFRYKDYRTGEALKVITLDGVEFVRRLARRILPPGFTKIRHYGILGNNCRQKWIPLARAALAAPAARRWLHPTTPGAVPPLKRTASCSRCGSEDLVRLGRLDARGRFTAFDAAASKWWPTARPPPPPLDSS